MRPILDACRKGNIETVKLLIGRNYDIEARGRDNRRPIHIACDNGHVDIVKLLIEKNCDIEARDWIDRRPIHYACFSVNVGILKLLIEKNCDIEARDKFDQRPIHIACDKGHSEIAKLLITEKCDIEACDDDNKRPIHRACRNGNIDIVKLILSEKCDMEARDKYGHRPIHSASYNGHADIVKLLIENKCDIEARDEDDWRPIHFACDSGNVDTVKLLIERKCDIEACIKDGRRPIHIACFSGNVDIVKLLLSEKCDIEARDKDGKSPLSVAKRRNHRQLIKEIAKEILVRKVKKASAIQCDTSCDHKSCPKNLVRTESRNKKVIGRGAFGKVYKITDPETNLEYALKSIEVDLVDEDVKKEDSNKEAKNLEADINEYRNIIKHPRIMEYFGSILCSSKIYIFMELVSQGSLHTAIMKAGSLPHLTIIRYSQQILEGLEFLHGKKIIHRDIKPPNILIDDKGGTKLCDFGLSKVLQSISTQSRGNTKGGAQATTFCGTRHYMAPEVIDGGGYRFSADIWSVGATIVHMLTGQPPYFDMHEAAIIHKIWKEKRIEFEPREPMSDNMKLFMTELLNPDHSKRKTATDLLQFLIDHDMLSDIFERRTRRNRTTTF